MKPTAWDLCAGMGGGSAGLKAAGFKVIAFDIEAWPNPHADVFVQGDIRDFSGKDLMEKYGKPAFIWASPPCQQFSYRSFPFKRCRILRDTVPPDKSIWEACQRLADECECPIVIENVRGAEGVNYLHPEWFMGKAKAHYGSFYLWGDVPALLPISGKNAGKKGFTRVDPLYMGGKRFQGQGNSPAFGWNDEKVQSARRRNTFSAEKDAEKARISKKNGFPGEVARQVYKGRQMSCGGSQHTSSHSSARKEWSAKAAMIPLELSTFIGKCFFPGGL